MITVVNPSLGTLLHQAAALSLPPVSDSDSLGHRQHERWSPATNPIFKSLVGASSLKECWIGR